VSPADDDPVVLDLVLDDELPLDVAKEAALAHRRGERGARGLSAG
jgi:hypothetical protein